MDMLPPGMGVAARVPLRKLDYLGNAEGMSLGWSPKNIVLKTNPFILAINVTNDIRSIFYIRLVLEKHKKVAVLESKESMFVACWQ